MNKILKIINYLICIREMISFKFYKFKIQINYKIKAKNFCFQNKKTFNFKKLKKKKRIIRIKSLKLLSF